MITWLTETDVRAIHQKVVGAGVRDANLLGSAVARPMNLNAYVGESRIHRLAASYGFGLACNHPFHDGNKRTALVCVGVFLELNSWVLSAPEEEAVAAMVRLADGSWDEETFAAFLLANVTPLTP